MSITAGERRPLSQSQVDGPDRITVGIVVNEVRFRAGVRGVLEDAGEIVVVGEARDGRAAVELARMHRPQVLLMDTAAPGMSGLVAVRQVRRHVPATRVVMLAGSSAHAVPALRAGASGFLLKNGGPDELVHAVRVVAAGEAVLCPAVIRSLVEHMDSETAERQEHARKRVASLTTREREVLLHVAKGLANVKIARAMWLSEGSIKAYVSRVFTKLGCGNRLQAALIAHDAGLFNQWRG